MEQKYIFILGHMRSYSSLLSHILGSHNEISGYTELHQSYNSLSDFSKMQKKISFAYDKRVKSRFLLDKILHNDYSIQDFILTSQNTYLIFLLRRPEETIKSVIQMATKLNTDTNNLNTDPGFILDYYTNRLEQLTTYAEKADKPILFIEAEELINDNRDIFTNIQKFLDLIQPITSEYNTYKLTGKRYYGDGSKEIYSGKVIKDKKNREEIIIPEDILFEAQRAYDRCKKNLSYLS